MPKANFKNLLIFIIIVQIYRVFVLLNAHFDLYVDEAYYWEWSKHLAFGYYSKPPMIAWVIALFTSICGDSILCIKLPTLLLYPITTIVIYLVAKELFDRKIAFWSGVAFITLPSVSISSLIISTDVLLLLFWSLTLLLFLKALKTDHWGYWIAAGISAGAGLLTKYTMILFVISVVLYAIFLNRALFKNIKLYATMLIAALIYLPNLIWNAQHHFITFVHTKNLSEIEAKSHFHFNKLIEFLSSQFLVFGPVFFAALLYLFIRPYLKEDRYKTLYIFSVPFLLVISFQAFLSKALANWAAPTYVAATILVVAYLLQNRRVKLLLGGILINIALTLLFYHYYAFAKVLHIPITKKTDPFKRVKGFSLLAKKLEPIIKKYPNTKLLFDERTTMAEMIYYLKPHPFDAVILNPSHHIGSQFHLTTDLERHRGEDFIYVTKFDDKNARRYFASSKLLTTITIPVTKDFARTYRVYYLKTFKGYK